MFFIFVGDDMRSKTELRFQLHQFHVFGELAFFFHLFEIGIILVFVFGIGDLNHVLVEQPQKLGFFHWFLYLFELLFGELVHL